MEYGLHIVTMTCLYVMLALSLNILVGYVGLLSMCQAGFYAIGSYGLTLLMMQAHLPFFLALPAAMAVAVLLSAVVGLPSLRLRGDYFVLASLGFQIIIYTIIYNWQSLTGGPYGISGIPRPQAFGFTFTSIQSFAGLTVAVTAVFVLVLSLALNSPFGRTLKAIRDDEMAAAALGKNVPRIKAAAFALSGGLAAVPGALFAVYAQYIDPASFGLVDAVFIVATVIVGGTGNMRGPIVGGITMVLLPEALRFMHMPDILAANVRQILFGVLLVILMRFRPQGILGNYRLT